MSTESQLNGDLRERLSELEATLSETVWFEIQEQRDIFLGSVILGQHLLLEGEASVGKTTMATEYARIVGFPSGVVKRVQGSPDTMPSDITGSIYWDESTKKYEFNKGPIFAKLLIVDEINRMSPRSSAGLHQALAEGQVTPVGSTRTYNLDPGLVVIATQNPSKSITLREGIHENSKALTDRFGARIVVPYPSVDGMMTIENCDGKTTDPVEDGQAVVSEIRSKVKDIAVGPKIIKFSATIINSLRSFDSIDQEESILAGPRAISAINALARFMAFKDKRREVGEEDVKKVMPYCLGHRVVLSPMKESDPESFIRNLVQKR